MTLGPDRDTTAARLLAEYRATGNLPRISGGDHESEDDGNDGGTESSENQNDNANSGGEQEDRSEDSNGFKAISSQAELDNLISRRLGRERKKLEKSIRDELEAEAKRKADEEQGEFRKLYEEAQEALKAERAARQQTTARISATDEATRAGAISPRAVFAMIRDDITYTDDGEPENIAELIAKAKADEPHLFRASEGSGDGGKGGDSGKDAPDINDRIRRMARRNHIAR